MIKVVPAIIENTRKDIIGEVSLVKSFVDTVQIDIMDGIFTHTKSWPFTSDNARDELEILKNTNIKLIDGNTLFELDLMVDRPEYFLDLFLGTGASALIFHIDSTSDMDALIEKTKKWGVRVAIAIRPYTSLDLLLPYLDRIDFVQCMGSDKIGYHGVKLDGSVYERITRLREVYPDGIIGVDIGVDEETAPRLVKAGANKLVAGSAIFDSDDMEDSIRYFSNLGNNES